MDERDLHCEHEHGENCDCSAETIFITFEDDQTVECNIVAVFDHNEQDYIAINPMETDEILIYKLIESLDSEDGMELVLIESDEEYNDVADIFYSILGDDQEYEDEEEE